MGPSVALGHLSILNTILSLSTFDRLTWLVGIGPSLKGSSKLVQKMALALSISVREKNFQAAFVRMWSKVTDAFMQKGAIWSAACGQRTNLQSYDHCG